jgi:thioredoxin-like negative regulator of GroEL
LAPGIIYNRAQTVLAEADMSQLRSALVIIVAAWCCFQSPGAAKSNSAKLLFFTAPWCSPCGKMKPLVEGLARKYKVEMVLVDFDQSPGVVREFSVQTLPTMVLLDSKGQLRFKASGASRQIIDALTAALKTLAEHKKKS